MPERLPLQQVFTAVPPRYDLVNRVVTLGRDQAWRREAARECLEGAPGRVLDLCCGTADLAVELKRRGGERLEVVGLDFSAPMLELARRKAETAAVDIGFVEGDAGDMPFPDGAFQRVAIAFGFRNLTWRNPRSDRHLAEVLRVLAPGGRFVIVESSQPRPAWLRAGFHAFLRGFVGPVGVLLSGQGPAYRYLAESAARFPGPEGVRDLLAGAGFAEVRSRPLMAGAVAVHVATR